MHLSYQFNFNSLLWREKLRTKFYFVNKVRSFMQLFHRSFCWRFKFIKHLRCVFVVIYKYKYVTIIPRLLAAAWLSWKRIEQKIKIVTACAVASCEMKLRFSNSIDINAWLKINKLLLKMVLETWVERSDVQYYNFFFRYIEWHWCHANLLGYFCFVFIFLSQLPIPLTPCSVHFRTFLFF